jgi:lipopolysaccharide/colanic/teichoic acid biosynthesis glycosyltransferase
MYFFLKRGLDLAVSLGFLLLFSPLFVAIILILRFTGEGEVFFLQERVGFKEQPFKVWKFATMLKNSPSSGTVTAANDPRVLPFGKFLRLTKLNEIAQIFNIIRGDMSLVGPRPLTRECFDCYPDDVKHLVYQSKPGLTGLGSVVFRKEDDITARSGKPLMQSYREDVMPVKGALEAWYLINRSFVVDLKIIVLTALAIVLPGNQLHHRWFKGLPALEAIQPSSE